MSNKNLDYKALFEDGANLNNAFLMNLIIGAVLFSLVLLVGWLVFDYFWTSLTIGVVILLSIFNRMVKISIEKNAYDKFTRKYQEEAEVLGLDGEVSEYMVEEALRILGNATSKQEAG